MILNKNILLILAISNIIVVMLLNQSVVLSIVHEWEINGPYSHGSLGFLVFIAAIWQRKKELSRVIIRPSRLGCIFLLLSLLTLFLANIASIQQLQQLSLFAVIVSSFMYIMGIFYIKALSLPFLILLLNLPVWNLLEQPLRVISTEASYIGANLLGTNIDRQDFLFRTAGGNFEVEPACSGLGFFLVSALLAICLSCFERLNLKQTIKFLLVALTVAIVANWVRIITIVVVGNETQMQHFIVSDHLTFGWVVFFVFLVPLIMYSKRFMSAYNASIIDESSNYKAVKLKTSVLHSVIASVMIVSSTLSYQWFTSRYDANYMFNLPELSNFELISTNKTMSPNWQPNYLGVSSEQFHYYIDGDIGFQVYVANYVRQYQAHEMIYVENKLFDKRAWQEVGSTKITLDIGKGLNESNLLELQSNGRRHRLISYWYAIAGGYTADKKIAKLREVTATLRGHPEASIIAISVDYRGNDRDKALAAITQFTAEFVGGSSFISKN